MRKRVTTLFLGLFATASILNAQYDDLECATVLSIFSEHAKVKNYDAAYEPWKKLKTDCPDFHYVIYYYGEKMLNDRIKKGTGDKQANINDLMAMYDGWAQYFPTRKGKNELGKILSKKAQAMADNDLGSKKEIYDAFDMAYVDGKESFSNPKSLYYYFSTYFDMYKAGQVPLENVFNKYEDVTEKFEEESTKLAKKLDKIIKKEGAGTPLTSKETKNKKVYNINSTAIGKFQGNLDALIAGESTCTNLVPLYRKNFDANRSNSVWLNRAASRMNAKECDDDPLFIEIVEALHTNNPSADSAYYLFVLNNKKGNSSEADRYLQESISLESDPYKKANKLYKVGSQLKRKGSKSKARKYFNQALEIQPSMGKAYLAIANMYASSANQCGSTPFEKRAIYWKAAQVARKAGSVDASIKSLANKTAAAFAGRAPSKTEIFNQGMAGKTITFNCWVGGSVKVPNL